MLIALVFCAFLNSPIASADSLPNVVATESSIYSFLAQREGWAKEETSLRELSLTSDARIKFRLISAPAYCGRGVCPQYLFRQLGKQRWKLIGYFSGYLTISTEVRNGYRLIETTTSLGASADEKIVERFQFDGTTYVAAP